MLNTEGSPTSTFKNLQDDILSRIKGELAAMKQETMDSMVIEFTVLSLNGIRIT